MSTFSFKRTFFSGIALALPVCIVLYVLVRLLAVVKKVISPIATRLGIETLFGGFTLTIIAIFLMLIVIFLFGLLMQFRFVVRFREFVEGWILKLVPSLNHLKMIAAEKLEAESASEKWKPVFACRLNQDEYVPAYIIEENSDWITLAFTNIPSTEPGNVLITKKSLIKYTEISMTDMHQYNREYGKGYLSLVDKSL